MNWLIYYDRSYHDNLNYFDLMGFLCKYLNELLRWSKRSSILNSPDWKIILRLRDEPKSLGAQYKVRNETQMKNNQKVIKNDHNELVVKNYPKNKQPNIQQRKVNYHHVLVVREIIG